MDEGQGNLTRLVPKCSPVAVHGTNLNNLDRIMIVSGPARVEQRAESESGRKSGSVGLDEQPCELD